MDWMNIFRLTIVGVLTASILAFLGWIVSPLINDPQPVKATFRYIEMPNPFLTIKEAPTKKSDPLIVKWLQLFRKSKAYDDIELSGKILVGSIEISNESDERSGSIEVFVKDGFSITYNKFLIPTQFKAKRVLKPMNPHEKITINFLASSGYLSPTIHMIHNNRNVDVLSMRPDFVLPFYEGLVIKFPFMALIFIYIGISVIILGAVFLMFYIFIPDKIKFRAKHITAPELKSSLSVIEYIKTHYPEKMPPNDPPAS